MNIADGGTAPPGCHPASPLPPRPANRPIAAFVLGAVAAIAGATFLGGGAASAPEPGRCVGMFMAGAPGSGGSLPRQIAADSNGLTLRGTVPCAAGVMAWAPQGPCRVFEDGTVEILVSPVPPCPGGDFYAWLAYPR